jgi:DNA replication protein DnaC
MPLDLPPGVRTLTNTESARLEKDHPLATACITCEGRGTYRWWDDPDPDNLDRQVVVHECQCVEQRMLHRYLLNAGIGEEYQRLGWADMRWTEAGAMSFVLDYMDRAEAYMRAGRGMLLQGGKGTGKTGLATLVLKALLARGHDGYFITFNGLLDLFTSSWRDPEDKQWFHRRVKNTGVLVLDDAGRENAGRMSMPVMDEIIRHRVASSRPTIVTSNQDQQSFAIRYGEYVVDLLVEQATPYTFAGTSRRSDVKTRKDEEIDLGLTRPIVIG